MERDNLMHGARTALNTDMDIRAWAENYLKEKTRGENTSMTDEEFEKTLALPQARDHARRGSGGHAGFSRKIEGLASRVLLTHDFLDRPAHRLDILVALVLDLPHHSADGIASKPRTTAAANKAIVRPRKQCLAFARVFRDQRCRRRGPAIRFRLTKPRKPNPHHLSTVSPGGDSLVIDDSQPG
jgi:hypothetical protein